MSQKIEERLYLIWIAHKMNSHNYTKNRATDVNIKENQNAINFIFECLCKSN